MAVFRSLSWSFLATTLLACGADRMPPPVPSERRDVLRFLPEGEDLVCRYQADSTASGKGIYSLEIRRRHGDRIEISTSRGTRRLLARQHALREPNGASLLVAPLEPNATWQGESGLIEVLETDVSVEVPAGKLRGCVKTVERSRSGAARLATTTTYCPGSGIALMQHEHRDGDRLMVREEARLEGCTERMDVQAPGF